MTKLEKVKRAVEANRGFLHSPDLAVRLLEGFVDSEASGANVSVIVEFDGQKGEKLTYTPFSINLRKGRIVGTTKVRYGGGYELPEGADRGGFERALKAAEAIREAVA